MTVTLNLQNYRRYSAFVIVTNLKTETENTTIQFEGKTRCEQRLKPQRTIRMTLIYIKQCLILINVRLNDYIPFSLFQHNLYFQ